MCMYSKCTRKWSSITPCLVKTFLYFVCLFRNFSIKTFNLYFAKVSFLKLLELKNKHIYSVLFRHIVADDGSQYFFNTFSLMDYCRDSVVGRERALISHPFGVASIQTGCCLIYGFSFLYNPFLSKGLTKYPVFHFLEINIYKFKLLACFWYNCYIFFAIILFLYVSDSGLLYFVFYRFL